MMVTFCRLFLLYHQKYKHCRNIRKWVNVGLCMWNQLGWKWYLRSLWRRTPREMLTHSIFRYGLYKNCNYVVEFPLKYLFNMTFSAVNPASLYNPLNSSPYCAAYMRQSTGSAFVQIIAFSNGFIIWGIIKFEMLFWYSKANIEMCNYYSQSTIVLVVLHGNKVIFSVVFIVILVYKYLQYGCARAICFTVIYLL